MTILDLLTVGLGLAARRLLGQQHGLDVGQHSSLRDIVTFLLRFTCTFRLFSKFGPKRLVMISGLPEQW